MARNYLTNPLKVDVTFLIFLSALILFVPFKLAMSWLLAVFVHELSHCLILRLYNIPIHIVHLRYCGVIIDTGPMSKMQELFSAIAGPVGGLCLLLVARWLPYTAICALIHSIYNLLPTFPSDGGRALRCILIKVFGEASGIHISKWIHHITNFLLFSLTLYAGWKLQINLFPLFVMEVVSFLYTNRKLPCKHRHLIVQ